MGLAVGEHEGPVGCQGQAARKHEFLRARWTRYRLEGRDQKGKPKGVQGTASELAPKRTAVGIGGMSHDWAGPAAEERVTGHRSCTGSARDAYSPVRGAA